MYLDTIPNDFEAMKGHKRVFELAGRHAKEGLETLSWMMRATKDWDMSQEQVGECGYMDIRAVANYLGVSIPAIKAWRRKGQFAEPHMFGRRVRWNPEDVKEWAQKNKEKKTNMALISVQSSRAAFQSGGKDND